MTRPLVSVFEDTPAHALNNLFTKILGFAEFALDRVSDPQAQAELRAIIALAESGGEMVAAFGEPGAIDEDG